MPERQVRINVGNDGKALDPTLVLALIYASIPKVKCPEGCTRCCGPVTMSNEESAIMGLEKPWTPWDKNHNCGFIKDGKCSCYEKRPFVCRLFGATKDGVFSCKMRPEGKDKLDENQVMQLFMLYQLLHHVPATSMEEAYLAGRRHDINAGFMTEKQALDMDELHRRILDAERE